MKVNCKTITRREAIAFMGGLALSGINQVLAQGRVRQIGFLHVGNDHEPPSYKPLIAGMRELGYEEGRNVRYDFRNVVDDTAALEAARTFARDRFDLIVGFDAEACAAAQKATTTLPIVMVNVGDPVAAGFAKTLAHPGGNMTGFAGRAEIPAKELEFLRELAPKLMRILVLFDSREISSIAWRASARAAAKRLNFTLVERDVTDAAGVRQVFEQLKPGMVEAMMFASAGLRHRHMRLGLSHALDHKLLVIANRDTLVEQGALFSYSYDFAKVGHASAGRYVDLVLKGKSPRDLPIEEVTEYALTVNGRTMRRAGLAIPQSILLRADKVIE